MITKYCKIGQENVEVQNLANLITSLTPSNIKQIKYRTYSTHPQLINTLSHLYNSPYFRLLLLYKKAAAVTQFHLAIHVFSNRIF